MFRVKRTCSTRINFPFCFIRNFNEEARLKIGKSIEIIPEDYKTFFTSGKQSILREEAFAPNLKLFLHLTDDPQYDSKLLLVENVKEVNKFLLRLRVLLKWGHFFWRLSDLSALQIEPTRICKPTETETEMKIYWKLKVKGDDFIYVDGKLNLKSILQVQFNRLFPNYHEKTSQERVIYTGISRYVFDETTGSCRELHVERIEPKITSVEWKWRLANNPN